MSAIYFHSFSRAYNKWLDYVQDFRADFDDSQEFLGVLKVIVDLLNGKLDYPIEDPEHPFRRYADTEKTLEENYHVLAVDVLSQVQDSHLRGYVSAFFHSSGANYSDMKELMDMYCTFADRAEDEDYSDGTTITDSECEEDEEDEEEEETDAIPPEHDSSNPNSPY